MTTNTDLRGLRERGQAGRRNGEPDQVADQESGDERRGALRAARQRARNDRRDAGTRRGNRQQIDRGKNQQAVERHDTLQHIPRGVLELTHSASYLIAQVPSPVRQARPSDVRERPSSVACSVKRRQSPGSPLTAASGVSK